MRTLLVACILTTLYSCLNKQNIPRHSDVFNYIDKNTHDTIKFYCYKDIDSAMAHAKNEDKNILVIFSCWSCMATPKMEWKTLAIFGDNKKIYDNFIIAWLPVDDKIKLKDSLEANVIKPGYYVKTIGMKNYALQIEKTKTNTQPTLCFFDQNGAVFGQKISYTPDKDEIEKFINSGLTK